jgi:hypothetical protein
VAASTNVAKYPITIKNHLGPAMSYKRIVPVLVLAICFYSCKRNLTSPSIIGNWRSVECFVTDPNSQSRWIKVTPEDLQEIEFASSGAYLETNRSDTSKIECSGTYTVVVENSIKISSNCQTEPYSLTISELSSSTLILDNIGREGVTRMKYSR